MRKSLIVLALVATQLVSVLGEESRPLAKDVPPVLGIAIVTDPGNEDPSSESRVRLTLPRASWKVVGDRLGKEPFPTAKVPELVVRVENAILDVRLGGPSALAPSRIVDLKGRELSHVQILERLKREAPVLVSVSGKMPDAHYLQLTKQNALVVLLGPRDGSPAPKLLPSESPVDESSK